MADTAEPYRTLDPVLVFDHKAELPVQFRESATVYATAPFSMSGLASLKASGSSQYDSSQLTVLLGRLHSGPGLQVVLVDLRQESHIFINGLAVGWYAEKDWANVGRSLEWIEDDEDRRVQGIVAAQRVIVSTLVKGSGDKVSTRDPMTLDVSEAMTEVGLAQQRSVGYFRIPVTDHCRPTDDMVDRFVAFVKGLKTDTWLHFHCHGGDGRTTTFLTLYDMIRNVPQGVDLDDIVARQSMMGQYPLFRDGGGWKARVTEGRTAFIKQFYTYVKSGGYDTKVWSEWIKG